MTDFGIAEVTGWSALRSVVAALFAVGAGSLIAQEMQRLSGGWRGILWMLVLATILAPDLIAGYAFSNFSLSLIRDPAWNEAFVTLLFGLKAMAVAAVMLRFSPGPSLSPTGRHLLQLSRGRTRAFDRWWLVGRGVASHFLPAFAIAFLFSFQQFELPSLTAATAWTVTLFDRQALVPDPAESARSLVWPLAAELAALAPIVLFVLGAVAARRRSVSAARRRLIERGLAWCIAALAACLTAFGPVGILVRESVPGIGYVLEATPAAVSYWREVAIALAYGVTSAVIAFLVAVGLLKLLNARRWRTPGTVLLIAACVPGMCGPLVPSLFAVTWLQSPWLLPLRDTLVPLVTVLALFLLPRAILLEALSRLTCGEPACHLARSLRKSGDVAQQRSGRRLLWQLEGFGRYCRISLLAYWGYLDLTATTILAPTAVVPVTARLYNLMHYGHNASLSAMALFAVAIPAFAFAMLLVLRRLTLRLAVR